MKNYILLLLGLLLTIPAQAHFFAYKEWYNPTTGQVLEMYYDVHQTDELTINPGLQRKQFIQRAQQHKCVVITEDLESFYAQQRGEFNAQSSKKYLRDMVGDDSVCPSPLSFLCARCFIDDIPTFNAECRQQDDSVPLDQEYQDELDAYDDGDTLNEFYDSIKEYAYELDCSKDKTGTTFLETCLALDARMLHAIYTTTNNHLMLAAGASHLIRISNVLPHLGWQVKKTVISKKLTPEQRQDLADALRVYPEDTPVDANFRWNHYLNKNLSVLTSHTLDLTKTPVNELLISPPQPGLISEASLVTETHAHLLDFLRV